MPCIFLEDVPFFVPNNREYNGESVRRLRQTIASAAHCPASAVEIHLNGRNREVLLDDGTTTYCPNIHGFVLWFGKEDRGDYAKQKIAAALQQFLNDHDRGKGFDLTFLDLPAGSFYTEKNGKAIKVLGGEPAVPFSKLLYTVYKATGWSPKGFDPEDVELE